MASPRLRTMLITGASTGIGHELARIAAGKGHDVVLVARSADKLETLAEELGVAHGITATAIPLDLATEDAVDTLARELEARTIVVDALVNNAGFGASGPFHAESPARIRQVMQLNVVTLTMLMRCLLPGMVERGNGAVLNVASVAGFNPGPGVATYHATKAYDVSLSLATRRELRGTGVTVSCLCPGPVTTDFQYVAGQGNITPSQRRVELSAERVAQVGYDALVRGKALAIPGLSMKLAVQLSRHAPLRVVTAMTGRALHGSISGYQ